MGSELVTAGERLDLLPVWVWLDPRLAWVQTYVGSGLSWLWVSDGCVGLSLVLCSDLFGVLSLFCQNKFNDVSPEGKLEQLYIEKPNGGKSPNAQMVIEQSILPDHHHSTGVVLPSPWYRRFNKFWMLKVLNSSSYNFKNFRKPTLSLWSVLGWNLSIQRKKTRTNIVDQQHDINVSCASPNMTEYQQNMDYLFETSWKWNSNLSFRFSQIKSYIKSNGIYGYVKVIFILSTLFCKYLCSIDCSYIVSQSLAITILPYHRMM